MSLQEQKKMYSEEAYETIYEYLCKESERGSAVSYEVFVDSIKVIRRTDDPERLHEALSFVRPGITKDLFVNIYNYGESKHYDRTRFLFGDVEETSLGSIPISNRGLSGPDMERMVEERVQKMQKEMQYSKLSEDFQRLEIVVKQREKEIEELEEEVEKLEQEKVDMLARESPLKGVLGDVGAGLVESLIKRNPTTVARLIPGGESLAGFLEEDERKRMNRLSAPSNEAEVVFTEKNSNVSEDPSYQLIRNIRGQFSDAEFAKVLQILDVLIEDRSRLDTIHSLVTES